MLLVCTSLTVFPITLRPFIAMISSLTERDLLSSAAPPGVSLVTVICLSGEARCNYYM